MSERTFRAAGWLVVSLLVSIVVFGCSGDSGTGGGGGAGGLSVTAVTPNVGVVGSTTNVTITGTGFATGATVRFGTNPATNVVVVSATTITCTTPSVATPGAVDVVVTVGVLSATLPNGFTFAANVMTFTAISPNSGTELGGTVVQISGTNFNAITQVTLGGVPLTNVTNPSASLIMGTTGARAAGVVDLVIMSSTRPTLTVPGIYTYTVGTGGGGGGGPTITSVVPNNGSLAGGDLITINGTGFLSSVSVLIAGAGSSNVSFVATQITCRTPPAPAGFSGGPVSLTVQTASNGSTTLGAGFTYNGAGGIPTLTAITPATGPESGGTNVTITGSNFLSGLNSNVSAVMIGAQQLLNLTIVNGNTITGRTPVGMAGAVQVRAINTMGQQSNALTFTYTPSLFINFLNPNQGPVAGGTVVTITGRNFTTANIGSITFTNTALGGGSADATNVNVVNATTLTCVVPAAPGGIAGPANVKLNGVGIAPATILNGYTYGPFFGPALTSDATVTTATPIAMAVGTFLKSVDIPGAAVITPTEIKILQTVPELASRVTPAFSQAALGIGAGTFVDVKLCDMNNDGTLDVVTLLNNGPGVNTVFVATASVNTGAPAMLTALPGQPMNGFPVPGAGTATSLCVGLFDGDALYDVAVTVRGGAGVDRVEILRGMLPAGSLTSMNTVATMLPSGAAGGSLPSRVVCADPNETTTDPAQFREERLGADAKDMNSDGRADLVVTRGGDDGVSVLVNASSATIVSFSIAATTSTVGTNPQTLVIADLDDNGTLDVVCGNQGTANFSVLLGNGVGNVAFVATFQVAGPGTKEQLTIAVADFNFDCRPDVLVATFNNTNFTIFPGHGDGTFSDGVNYDAQIAAKRNTARIVAAYPALTSTNFLGMITLDANSTPANQSVPFVPRSLPTPVLGQPQAPPFLMTASSFDPRAVAIGDLNNDGRRDMLVANRASATLRIFLGDGMGNFTQPIPPIVTGSEPESIALADVNRDGRLDAVIACNGENTVRIHLNLGAGQLGAGTPIMTNSLGPHQVLARDLNVDRNIDLVTCNQFGNSVTVLLGDGMGGFVPPSAGFIPGNPAGVYPVGNAPRGIAIEDLNGDNKLDIVSANFADDSVTVLIRTDPAGGSTVISFGPATDYSITGVIPAQAGPQVNPVVLGRREPVSVAIGDLNGDNVLDIVTADKFSSTFTILHGDPNNAGTNFFVPQNYLHFNGKIGQPQVIYPVGQSPEQILLSDLDLDGFLDVITCNLTGASLSVHIQQGSLTQVTAALQPPTNQNPPALPVTNVVPGLGETSFHSLNNVRNSLITFTTMIGAPGTQMALGRLRMDCPPTVAVTCQDNMVRLFQVQ